MKNVSKQRLKTKFKRSLLTALTMENKEFKEKYYLFALCIYTTNINVLITCVLVSPRFEARGNQLWSPGLK
jgi:hypothetical protein